MLLGDAAVVVQHLSVVVVVSIFLALFVVVYALERKVCIVGLFFEL